MDMGKNRFYPLPCFGNKTRDKMREDTTLKNFPLFVLSVKVSVSLM